MKQFTGKVTVKTREEVLIGYISEPPNSSFATFASQGIWLRRERHFSYIANEVILEIRPFNVFDKEITNNQN